MPATSLVNEIQFNMYWCIFMVQKFSWTISSNIKTHIEKIFIFVLCLWLRFYDHYPRSYIFKIFNNICGFLTGASIKGGPDYYLLLPPSFMKLLTPLFKKIKLKFILVILISGALLIGQTRFGASCSRWSLSSGRWHASLVRYHSYIT